MLVYQPILQSGPARFSNIASTCLFGDFVIGSSDKPQSYLRSPLTVSLNSLQSTVFPIVRFCFDRTLDYQIYLVYFWSNVIKLLVRKIRQLFFDRFLESHRSTLTCNYIFFPPVDTISGTCFMILLFHPFIEFW